MNAATLPPHEPAAGLLGLLHGASHAELRHLLVVDIDFVTGTVQLGKRPNPTPLDPSTATAVRRCVDQRTPAARLNPHLFVNQSSKTVHGSVAVNYLERVLAPAGVTPSVLRATRLAHLVTVMDPILVSEAFGVRPGAAMHYLADSVDPGRLPHSPGPAGPAPRTSTEPNDT